MNNGYVIVIYWPDNEVAVIGPFPFWRLAEKAASKIRAENDQPSGTRFYIRPILPDLESS